MQAEQFDLILQMQGNGSIVNEMLENLNAGPVAGFTARQLPRPRTVYLEYPDWYFRN
jgi:hypothetical protein